MSFQPAKKVMSKGKSNCCTVYDSVHMVYNTVCPCPSKSAMYADGGKGRSGEYSSIMSALDASGWPQGYLLSADATTPTTSLADLNSQIQTATNNIATLNAKIAAVNQIIAGTNFENQTGGNGCAGLKSSAYQKCVHQSLSNFASQAALLGLSYSDADVMRQGAATMLPSLQTQLTAANTLLNTLTAQLPSVAAADPNVIAAQGQAQAGVIAAQSSSSTTMWMVGGGIVLVLLTVGYFMFRRKA